jgi:WD40 repeat protein
MAKKVKPIEVYDTHVLYKEHLNGLKKKEREELTHRDRFVGGLCYIKGYIISASEDGTIRVTMPGGSTKVLEQHDLAVNYIALNHDHSQLLACNDDGLVYIYNMRTFELIDTMRGLDSSGVRKAAFSRKGKIIAATNSGQLGIWDLEKGTHKIFDAHIDKTVDALVTHPTKEIAVSNDMSGVTLVWDLETEEITKTISEQTGHFIAGMFHHGANSAYWSDDYLILGGPTVQVFNNAFELLHEFRGFAFPPRGLCVQDGTVWGSGDYIKAWSLETGEELCSKKQKDDVFSIAIDNEGHLFTGHKDGSVKKWELSEMLNSKPVIEHGGDVEHILANDTYIITASEDHSIIIWNAQGKGLSRYYGVDHRIAVAGFVSENSIAIVDDRVMKILSIPALAVEKTIDLHQYFMFQSGFDFGDDLYFSGVGQVPMILNKKTLERTEIRHKTTLYEYSNVLNDCVMINGYTSLSDEFEPEIAKSLNMDPDHEDYSLEILEAPIVQFNVKSKTIEHTYWLGEDNRYGTWEDDSLYPTVCHQFDDYFIAGYCDGKIARWRYGADKPEKIIRPSEHYVDALYPTTEGYLMINCLPDAPLMLLDHDLYTVQEADFSGTVSIRHFDVALNRAVIVDHDNYGVLFIDGTTLAVTKRVKTHDLADKVVRMGDNYYAFAGGECYIIPV